MISFSKKLCSGGTTVSMTAIGGWEPCKFPHDPQIPKGWYFETLSLRDLGKWRGPTAAGKLVDFP